jgi:hypothetical protein
MVRPLRKLFFHPLMKTIKETFPISTGRGQTTLVKKDGHYQIKLQMNESASKVFNNLKDDFYDNYGPEMENFFQDSQTTTTWSEAVRSKYVPQEDKDDWFDDNIDEVVHKGFVDSTFLRFFDTTDDKDDDKQSVASWGTGNTTAYTEIVTSHAGNQ